MYVITVVDSCNFNIECSTSEANITGMQECRKTLLYDLNFRALSCIF